jgi:hypothetical protein
LSQTTRIVLWFALLLIVALAFLTVRVIVNSGFDILVVISLLVLAILGFGVLGALGSSADE